MAPDSYDVAIIGGGIVGLALARELSRTTARTVLLERECDVGFGTTKANSGIVHAGVLSDPAMLKGRLDWPGNLGWQQWQRDLGFGMRTVGMLVVAIEEPDLDHLEELLARAQDKGIPGVERWDPTRTLAAEPHLNPDLLGALWAPTAAVTNPYEAALLLADHAVQHGVEIARNEPVLGIEDGADGHHVLRTPTRTVLARFVVNAAGLYADEVAAMAGVGDFTIRPRRGEEYLLDRRLAGLVDHLIFPCPTPTTKGVIVNPTVDGTIMVGPTAETIEDKDDVRTTPAGIDAVFTAAQRLVPGLSRHDVIAEFAGNRAVLDSEDFLIGPTERPGFLNAAGIQSPGLTAAPAIAELLVDMLQAEGLDLTPRDGWEPSVPRPVRFADLDDDDRRALAATDPRYARIVCRCELITEGEVRDAVTRGADTLDSLKFRTRVGMGRCQGAFCTLRSMEVIASTLGTPFTDVTKHGGESWLSCPRTSVGV
jgi:glycerol-3-phosphate dehydrogenase